LIKEFFVRDAAVLAVLVWLGIIGFAVFAGR
jgi:hypothetical protein